MTHTDAPAIPRFEFTNNTTLIRLKKAELKKEQAEKERFEQDLSAQENKIRLLEDNLDQSEERVSKLTQQLTTAETVRIFRLIVFVDNHHM